MDEKEILIIIMMLTFIATGILQAIAICMYTISNNKTSYGDDACVLIVFKSIINILDGIYIWCIFYQKKKENIYCKILKLMNIIIYIIGLTFFANIKEYDGIFIINIIAIEISQYVIIMLIIFLIMFLSYNGIINIDGFNKEVIISVPQIAVYPVNIELDKNDIPHASIVIFNYATLI